MMDLSDAYLYRLYDDRGELLYVGVAGNFLVRWSQHASEKAWWPRNGSARFEWFESRESALAAELRAIRDEKPRFNIQGRSRKEARQLFDEEDAMCVLFGFPDDREPECYFDPAGLAWSVGWSRHRFRGAMARLHAKRRIALQTIPNGGAYALLLEPVA